MVINQNWTFDNNYQNLDVINLLLHNTLRDTNSEVPILRLGICLKGPF